MLTCKQCIYNQISVSSNKEMQRMCTRFPPTLSTIPTNQGVVVNVSYPHVTDDFVACGEFFDGLEDVQVADIA